ERSWDVGVIREHRGADDQDQVPTLEGLGDRADSGRENALEERMTLREAESTAAGSGWGEDRPPLALRPGGRVLPGAGGVDVGSGDQDRAARRVESLGKRL